MRIGHAAIWTKDLERLKDFYVKYFNGTPGEKYINARKQFESYFISFEQGAKLEIMRNPTVVDSGCGEKQHAGYAHLAFSTGSRESVDNLTGLLRDNGYIVTSGPRVTGDGYYESCILDPDGNMVEITE